MPKSMFWKILLKMPMIFPCCPFWPLISSSLRMVRPGCQRPWHLTEVFAKHRWSICLRCPSTVKVPQGQVEDTRMEASQPPWASPLGQALWQKSVSQLKFIKTITGGQTCPQNSHRCQIGDKAPPGSTLSYLRAGLSWQSVCSCCDCPPQTQPPPQVPTPYQPPSCVLGSICMAPWGAEHAALKFSGCSGYTTLDGWRQRKWWVLVLKSRVLVLLQLQRENNWKSSYKSPLCLIGKLN